uniref:Putative secreted protein n=1 Tax=Anopheles darlingi TaxID=43151 RepID=A0A2M4DQ83_ANODA
MRLITILILMHHTAGRKNDEVNDDDALAFASGILDWDSGVVPPPPPEMVRKIMCHRWGWGAENAPNSHGVCVCVCVWQV